MTLKKIILGASLIGFMNASCAGTFELARVAGAKDYTTPKGEPVKRDDKRCQDLDDSASTWQAVALGAGALGATQGGLMVIPDVSKEVRVGLAVGTIVAGAVAIAAGALSKSRANSWAKECTGPVSKP